MNNSELFNSELFNSELFNSELFKQFILNPIYLLKTEDIYKPNTRLDEYEFYYENVRIVISYKLFIHSNIKFNSSCIHYDSKLRENNIKNIENKIINFNNKLNFYITKNFQINLEESKGYYIKNTLGKLRFKFIYHVYNNDKY